MVDASLNALRRAFFPFRVCSLGFYLTSQGEKINSITISTVLLQELKAHSNNGTRIVEYTFY